MKAKIIKSIPNVSQCNENKTGVFVLLLVPVKSLAAAFWTNRRWEIADFFKKKIRTFRDITISIKCKKSCACISKAFY